MKLTAFALAAGLGLQLFAQQASSVSVTGKKGEETIALHNVTFEVVAGLVLRKTEQSRQVIGEKGMDASTVVEAWPLTADRKGKPLYALKAEGIDGRTVDNALFTVQRGLEDVDWWSVYRLTDGKPLFDTHVALVRIPMSSQYAGFEVPADGDKRLTDDHLIGIAYIASANAIVRRIELRCDDAKRARLLRSYWDVRRGFAYSETKRALVLTIRDAAPDVTIEILLQGVVKVPAGIRAK